MPAQHRGEEPRGTARSKVSRARAWERQVPVKVGGNLKETLHLQEELAG